MDFPRLPSAHRSALSGIAGLALLASGAAPLAAEPVRELKRSIDEAGTAVNRQLGDWLGVAPDRPARSRNATRAKAAAIPLPPPRPQDIAAEPSATPAEGDTSKKTRVPSDDAEPVTPVAVAPALPPRDPRPGRGAAPAESAAAAETAAATPEPAAPPTPAPPPAAPEPPVEKAATDEAALGTAPVPLPPPSPEPRLAALPPPAPAAPAAAPEPPAGTPEPTICPELSNESLGVFTPVAVTATNTACTVDRGVSLSAIRMKDGRLVTLEPAATLRCEMAAAVARWVREGIEPAVATLGAPLDKVLVAGSQQCRPRNRVVGARTSEHGRGNAMDTRGYVLKDGRRFVIGAPVPGSSDAAMPVAFQELIKASACADFTTILGPGSDGYHEQHLHVDRAERRSGAVLCQWAVAEATAKVPSPPRKPDAPAAADATEGADEEAPPASNAVENPGTSQ
ncbi:hypothetical protein J2S75_003243 [Ancylobacter polymorphus]|uniref:Extensin-like C-terminal domain-containing protein n=2 Tax=Ancylobacter polymorphus TaxID=223390 RepID=A0ABU0BGN4_9HYPH|nr:extensin family protein [Ancylobacter polymorphus]MDQ0304207.1 hypothetical protein [Ancylobacter polymorphus]